LPPEEQPAALPAELAGDLGLGHTIEALLFVADRALSADELSEITEAPAADVAATIEALRSEYQDRGITILEHQGAFRMVSAPRAAPFCQRLLGLEARTRLSRAGLETLGVIAYRQPVTRAQIEEVRGVNSDSALATLLGRGLIEDSGRLEAPGRPVLFRTTDLFLAYFGISSLEALPAVELPSLGSSEEATPPEADPGEPAE
jgi:segregation and condensation protein B